MTVEFHKHLINRLVGKCLRVVLRNNPNVRESFLQIAGTETNNLAKRYLFVRVLFRTRALTKTVFPASG